ncbi:F-box protein At-B-like isoform X2 [Zingiber officinale]|uniref:F-box protein At-B-like isoform X2 n=1 Tax=Zingiber officinale TaxID=94328 RepID=UPI001C4C30A3|nr:F-box protein At-B-like isoform X2 [Zingiber officinale]
MAKMARDGNGGGQLTEALPQALLLEIMARLDLESLCSLAPVCKSLHSSVSLRISVLSTLDLSDISPTICSLRRILTDNKSLQNLILNCRWLDDSSVEVFAKESIRELVLLRCTRFSSYIFTAIGKCCRKLRMFTVEMKQVNNEPAASYNKSVGQMLDRCLCLESFSVKLYSDHDYFCNLWSFQLTIPQTIKVLLLRPISDLHAKQFICNRGVGGSDAWLASVSMPSSGPMIYSLRSLTLVVSQITDELVFSITSNLHHLVELCLEDNLREGPSLQNDLTNRGLELLGSFGKLISLSLTRGKKSLTKFKMVNDVGILLLAEGCGRLESLRLGGFAKVTDAGYSSILQFCKNLKRLQIWNGLLLSDLTFHNFAPTGNLTEVRLVSGKYITSEILEYFSLCENLQVLDLSLCRNIADEGLNSISRLCKMTTLNLSGVDISDEGLSTLGGGTSPIETLNLRGCKRITDRGIVMMLCDSILRKTLVTLDLSYLSLSDIAIVAVAEACTEISNLCIRNCFFISDASLSALGSPERTRGKRSLRKLDLFNCCRLSANVSRMVSHPFFCGLRWLGVGKTRFFSEGKDAPEELLSTKPGLSICAMGCEIGCKDGWQHHAGGVIT